MEGAAISQKEAIRHTEKAAATGRMPEKMGEPLIMLSVTVRKVPAWISASTPQKRPEATVDHVKGACGEAFEFLPAKSGRAFGRPDLAFGKSGLAARILRGHDPVKAPAHDKPGQGKQKRGDDSEKQEGQNVSGHPEPQRVEGIAPAADGFADLLSVLGKVAEDGIGADPEPEEQGDEDHGKDHREEGLVFQLRGDEGHDPANEAGKDQHQKTQHEKSENA